MQINIVRLCALLLTATIFTSGPAVADKRPAEVKGSAAALVERTHAVDVIPLSTLDPDSGKITALRSRALERLAAREAAAEAVKTVETEKYAGTLSPAKPSTPAVTPAAPAPSAPASGSSLKETESDVYWLAAIIDAEACDEGYTGRVAVGNVILARVASADFPDTIYGVIFDRNYGVQFTPVSNGTIYEEPCEGCIQAARDCLAGEVAVSGCLYFCNPALSESTWMIDNRPYVTTIGGHSFYA